MYDNNGNGMICLCLFYIYKYCKQQVIIMIIIIAFHLESVHKYSAWTHGVSFLKIEE